MLYTNVIRPQQTELTWFNRAMFLISLASKVQLSSIRIKTYCANLDYRQIQRVHLFKLITLYIHSENKIITIRLLSYHIWINKKLQYLIDHLGHEEGCIKHTAMYVQTKH